ncbi:MAG: nitroreductase [Cyclobacteriaceae bacterium]|nr:nitroreductase [Cyclobacteriaceae bacterium]
MTDTIVTLPAAFDIEEVNRLIRTRRSVYPPSYSGEVIPEEKIEIILENANYAPTHKLTQPWRFVVFSGKGLEKLAHFQSDLYKQVSEARGNFQEKTFETLRTKPLQASHIIAIGMKRDEKELVPEIEEVEAVACAVQNMYLTATALGLGAYWGSGGITYLEEALPFFGLQKPDKLLGFFYLGIPKGKWPKAIREDISTKVQWVVD